MKKLNPQAMLSAGLTPGLSAFTFLAISFLFFLALGKAPIELFKEMFLGAFGDSYSISETLVATTPVLYCALAVAIPARLGLLSVGGEGQFYAGAWLGTWFILSTMDSTGWYTLPGLLIFSFIGGGIWGAIPGILKTQYSVNETISTLLLNYVAALLVSYKVYGNWKDPNNLGWPATPAFPDESKIAIFGDTRLSYSILLAVFLCIVFHILMTRTRPGLGIRILKSNQRAGKIASLDYKKSVLTLFFVGGGMAGLAAMGELSVIHGRLQSGIALNFGLTGFLVAWLSGQNFLLMIPLALMMGALIASSDSLQLFAQLPAAISIVLQSLLFICVLAITGFKKRKLKA